MRFRQRIANNVAIRAGGFQTAAESCAMTFQEFAQFHQNSNLVRIDNLPRTLEMILVSSQTGDNFMPGDIESEDCAWAVRQIAVS